MESIIGYMILGAWILALLIGAAIYIGSQHEDEGVPLVFYLIALIITVASVSVHFNNL